MTVSHLKKKDVIKSSVKGIGIEFDHEQWPPYLIWEERHLKLHGSTYMDHPNGEEVSRYATVMMRHMSYVISMKDHELPYGDWLALVFEAFGVPLVIKKEKNLRNMISLKTPSSSCAGDRGEWNMVDRKWRE
ncbi:hypothetical protein Dimus_026759 [Dionaea muscipula]